MAGTFFQHSEGSIAARFHQSGQWWMWLALRVREPGTTETDVDDQWNTVAERTADIAIHRLKCRMSPCLCPFSNMIAWLESICRGVQLCEWSWNGEGSDYALLWNGNQLVASHNCHEVFRVKLDRASLVRALYSSFRRFALSCRYRPRNWEDRVTVDVLLEKVGHGLTPDEMRGRLILHDSVALNRALAPIAFMIVGSQVEPREKFRAPTADEQAMYGDYEGEQFLIEKLVDEAWDSWSIARRRARLNEIFARRMWGGPEALRCANFDRRSSRSFCKRRTRRRRLNLLRRVFMFVDEATGIALQCPYCRRAMEPSPCEHFVADCDSIEGQTCGPLAEWLEVEIAPQLAARFARLIKSGKQPPAKLEPLFASLREELGDEALAEGCAGDALIRELLQLSTTLADVKALYGVVDSGPGTSSSGTFYFAADSAEAKRRLLALIRSRETGGGKP